MPHPPLLIPQIGGSDIERVRQTQKAMEEVSKQIVNQQPEVIVIISPHGPMFEDAVTVMDGEKLMGNLNGFGVNLTYQIENDREFAREIVQQGKKDGLPLYLVNEPMKKRFQIKQELDYAAILPLHYLQKAGYEGKVVILSPGFVLHETLLRTGACIQRAGKKLNRRCVVIASGDNSHALLPEAPAGYAEEGIAFDQLLQESMSDGNWMALYSLEHSFLEMAAEDTLASMAVMLGVFDQVKLVTKPFSYEGPFGVGYTVALFQPSDQEKTVSLYQQLKQERIERLQQVRQAESEFVRLARAALETYIRDGRVMEAQSPENQEQVGQAGCFVSIKLAGRLRGCIGTIKPTRPTIAEEIIQNAISAGTEDERFYPIEESELEQLVYSVDILSKEERVMDRAQLDPKRYGIIITNGEKSGLLLPNLEGVDTVEDQIDITKEKAGISSGDQNVTIYRFEVNRYY